MCQLEIADRDELELIMILGFKQINYYGKFLNSILDLDFLNFNGFFLLLIFFEAFLKFIFRSTFWASYQLINIFGKHCFYAVIN